MKIRNIDDVKEFLDVVNNCEGPVTLTSKYGDRYNLKSALTQYIAIAGLIQDYQEDLELWCSDYRDEAKFMKMFSEHPEML